MIAELMIGGNDSSETSCRSPRWIAHSDMVDSSNRRTVLLSELFQLFTHVKGELEYDEDKIPKRLLK